MSPLNGTPYDVPTPQTVDPWRDLVVDELGAERARIEAEIAMAKSRAASARHRTAEREMQMRAALRAELLASKESIASIERQHELELSRVRDGAQVEVDRILSDADGSSLVEEEQVHDAG